MKHITKQLLIQYQKQFSSRPQNIVLQRSVMTNGIYLASRNPDVTIRDTNQWSYEIPAGSIRDQKKTGTCWLMATLVLAEKAINDNLKTEDVALSKSFLYFYDKLEMSNSFLQTIIDTKDEALESRHVQHILHEKQQDGGWMSNATQLIEKYGVVPEAVMPNTEDTEDSGPINSILNEKLVLYAQKIRSASDSQAVKQTAMAEIYHILALSFGVPPDAFSFDIIPKEDDDKKGKKTTSKKDLKTIHATPLEFWKKYGTKLNDFAHISFLLDHKMKHYGTLYEEDSVDAMYGKPFCTAKLRFSKEIEEAMKKQLMHDEPVWFAWDVGKQFSQKLGILDSELWKYDDIYDTHDKLEKDLRGLYQDYSERGIHATAIVGFREEKGVVTHWKVKNSWGKKQGQDGYISMNANYAKDYMLDVTLRLTYVPNSIRAVFETKPVIVRYWE